MSCVEDGHRRRSRTLWCGGCWREAGSGCRGGDCGGSPGPRSVLKGSRIIENNIGCDKVCESTLKVVRHSK